MKKKSITENNELSIESIPKLFIKFGIPAIIAMIITGLQGMIDGFFIGNVIGTDGMASVNMAMPFLQVIFGLSMVISIGSQSFIGLQLGSGNEKKARDAFQTFFRIIAASAILLTIIGLFFNRQIALLLGADAKLIDGTSMYIKTISIFALPMCLMFYFGFLDRIIGRPELYLRGSILSILVNILVNYIFIVRLEWGIFGAACATGTAYAVGLFFVMGPMLKKHTPINALCGSFDVKCIAPILCNGLSEGINSLSIAASAYLFNISLMQIAGADGVAAFTAISYIGSFGSNLLFGVSDGIGPIISYNFGCGKEKRVRKCMKLSYTVNLIFGTSIFITMFFFGEQLISFFVKGKPEVLLLATQGGKLYAFAFFLMGINILNSGFFTFIGKGLHSVIVALCRGIIFISIGIIFLPHILGTNGIWLCVTFAEVMCFIVTLFLFHINGKSSKIDITN